MFSTISFSQAYFPNTCLRGSAAAAQAVGSELVPCFGYSTNSPLQASNLAHHVHTNLPISNSRQLYLLSSQHPLQTKFLLEAFFLSTH